MLRRTLLVVAALALSCVTIDPPDGALRCNPSGKQCPDGYYCAIDNTCFRTGQSPTLPQGSACTAGGEACASGFCVDGFCCDSDCTGQCQACDVAGAAGTCTTVMGEAPHGSRDACATDGATCGGTCDGDPSACTYPTTACGTSSCTAGMATASACADGACVPANHACAPFACDASGASCAATCDATTDAGCDASHICNTTGTACVPKITFMQTTMPGGGGDRVAVADFNKDNKLDFAVASRGATFPIYLGNGDGTFTHTAANDPTGGNTIDMVLALDVNGDGNMDVVGVNQSAANGTVAFGAGNGTFTTQVNAPANGGTAIALATADFNGDTHPDFVFADDQSGGGFMVANTTGVNTYAAGVLTAAHRQLRLSRRRRRLQQRRSPRHRLLDSRHRALYIFLNNGAGTFTQKTLITPYARELFLADMNKDGKPDILMEGASSIVSVMISNGDGTFTGTPIGPGGNINGIATADFNGDGLIDVVISDFSGSQVFLYTATGPQLFQHRQKRADVGESSRSRGRRLQQRRQARPRRLRHGPQRLFEYVAVATSGRCSARWPSRRRRGRPRPRTSSAATGSSRSGSSA